MAYIGRQQDGFGVRSRFIYTATGGQTTFTTDNSSNALSYSDGAYVDVYLNGVLLDPSDYTATSLTSIVLDSGATASDILEVIVYDVFSVFSGTFTNGITASEATVTGDLTVDTNTLYVDSTNNRVGIGTASPDHPLRVSSSGFGTIAKFASDDGSNNPRLLIYGSSDGMHIQRTSGSGASNLMFEVGGAEGGGTEAMRIDSSGNLLVGKTSNSSAVAGAMLFNDGRVFGTKDGNYCAQFNRLTSDGEIIQFRKDGTTVGNIGADVGTISIDGGSTAAGILSWNGTRRFRWIDNFYPDNDNSADLGLSNRRWDNIYATNGTIQTSDQNEKQQIASLTSAEITAAKTISKLFKTFKWNDRVTAKGDAARTHAGVIAQEVQSAMTDAGLNATKYAFWCSDTWWETTTDVPAVAAVEAQDAVYDDDGNIVTEAVEAVEAKDAYTRTDTYDIADEAPEGATERTRLGIRYPELLAFVGAATEQRLADIETRLNTLENA